MMRLLDGIPLDTVSTSMTINATASTLLCLYLADARKQGVPFSKVNGTIQNDILKEYIARGTYISTRSLDAVDYRYIRLLFAKRFRTGIRFPSVVINIREAASTGGAGSCFHTCRWYCLRRGCNSAGMAVDEVWSKAVFLFNSHNNLSKRLQSFELHGGCGRE